MIRDQAAGLRERIQERPSADSGIEHSQGRGRTLAVSGGKGGVGKSNVSLNLAVGLGDMGFRVLLLDADFGLPNLDLLLGCAPRWSVDDVMRGLCEAGDALHPVTAGVSLVPGGDLGMDDAPDLQSIRRLLSTLSVQMAGVDYVIIDTQAGISPTVMGMLLAAEQVVMVTTPEPPSIMDAYRTLKRLNHHGFNGEATAVINRAERRAAESTFCHLQRMSRRFLSLDLRMLAWIPDDPLVGRAVRGQEPLLHLYPHSGAAAGINRLVDVVAGQPEGCPGSGRAFLRRLAGFLPRVIGEVRRGG